MYGQAGSYRAYPYAPVLHEVILDGESIGTRHISRIVKGFPILTTNTNHVACWTKSSRDMIGKGSHITGDTLAARLKLSAVITHGRTPE